MAASASTMMTGSVYRQVIEEVVSNICDEFLANDRPGKAVLGELQEIWESKLIQAGVRLVAADMSATTRLLPGAPAAPVHDLNVPYEGEVYETPTADMLFPPTPLLTPMPTPLPGSLNNFVGNNPTQPRDVPTPIQDAVLNLGVNSAIKPGNPNSYMETPSPWTNQRPLLGVDENVAIDERREEREGMASNPSPTQDFFMIAYGKRKRDDLIPQHHNGLYIPQQDGADDIYESLKGRRNLLPAADKEHRQMSGWSISRIPQVDGQPPGPDDEVVSTPDIYNYHLGVVSEDYNIAGTPAPNESQAATPAPHINNDLREDDEEEEPSLNENDDEDDLDDVDEVEETNTQHLVLAQFDKVTRTKSRWKCILKDGIMRVNDRDLLFNKATGEFDF